MNTVLTVLSAGVVWLVVAFVVAVWVGRWLSVGRGEWVLDEWAREDD